MQAVSTFKGGLAYTGNSKFERGGIMAENDSSSEAVSAAPDTSGCSPSAIIDAQKLNLMAISFAGALAAKLNDNERTALSLFLATVSTALGNIAFIDSVYDARVSSSESEGQQSSPMTAK